MKKVLFLTAIFLMVVLNNVFASGRKEGNGDVALFNRGVTSSFDAVKLSSKAIVYMYQNDKISVEIETDSNLEKYIKTDIKAGILEISETWNVSLQPTKYSINVYIPNISGLKISGQGTIYFNDKLKTSDIELKISGSGKIEGVLESDIFFADISGSGEINISGICEKANMEISGSGNINSVDLETNITKINISGSGMVKVTVVNTLTGKISGSGNIVYKGNPKIDIDISGKGSFKAL